MDQIKAPFTEDQVNNLNEYQNKGMFHPFTCLNDGDKEHISYEFRKSHINEDYNEYITGQKIKGIPYPEMEFNQTNLVATSDGWVCPVCEYKQKWVHSFMAEKIHPIVSISTNKFFK